MIPVVALQMIPVIFGKMLSGMLSGGFAPPAAWQTTAVFFMVLSAARKRYCFMCYKRYCLRAMINKSNFGDFWGGTFEIAASGTFDSVTGGTFHSVTGGTFETVPISCRFYFTKI